MRVLKEMDKLQNFQIYCEGSRVPLELSVDTSVLVGQRVIVKYLPGPCKWGWDGRLVMVDVYSVVCTCL